MISVIGIIGVIRVLRFIRTGSDIRAGLREASLVVRWVAFCALVATRLDDYQGRRRDNTSITSLNQSHQSATTIIYSLTALS